MFVWKWSWKVCWSLSFLMCNCKDLGLQAFQCAIARILVFKLFNMQLQRSHQSLSFLILVFELSDMQVSDQSLSFLMCIANQAVVYYLWIFCREISITRIAKPMQRRGLMVSQKTESSLHLVCVFWAETLWQVLLPSALEHLSYDHQPLLLWIKKKVQHLSYQLPLLLWTEKGMSAVVERLWCLEKLLVWSSHSSVFHLWTAKR